MQVADSLENLAAHPTRSASTSSLDDFGTGYSSLVVPARAPGGRDQDRPLVRQRARHNARDTSIVQGVIAMAAALGYDVVAEGVETAAQAEALRQIGCRYAQGFLWSRPAPAGKFGRSPIASSGTPPPPFRSMNRLESGYRRRRNSPISLTRRAAAGELREANEQSCDDQADDPGPRERYASNEADHAYEPSAAATTTARTETSNSNTRIMKVQVDTASNAGAISWMNRGRGLQPAPPATE